MPALFSITSMAQTDLPGVWAIEQTLSGPWTYGQLEAELATPHGWHFVITPPASRRILGYIFGTTILDEAEIRKLAVAPDYRRQGIASRLLAEIDHFLAAAAVATCFLELRAANTAALALYQKNGFQIVGQRKNYYTLPTDDAILARKLFSFLDLRSPS